MRGRARPLLATHLTLERGDHGVVLRDDEMTVSLSGGDAEALFRLLSALRGRRSVDELATTWRGGSASLTSVLEGLAEAQFVVDADLVGLPDVSATEWHAALQRECRFWSRHIYAGSFCRDLAAGQASLSQVLGWGIEFFHYVNHADTYMALAVAYCREDWRTRQRVSKQYVEELGHGEIFLQGLVGCGFDRARVTDAPPLAATRALLNFLSETACSNTLAYAACFAMTQPEPAPDATGRANLFHALGDTYPAARPLFDACLKHAELDARLGHDRTLLEELLASRDEVLPHERQQVVTTVRALAEHFMLFFEQIGTFYLAPSAQIPRRPPTWVGIS